MFVLSNSTTYYMSQPPCCEDRPTGSTVDRRGEYLDLHESSLLVSSSLFDLGSLDSQHLLASNSLLHAELHDRAEENTEVDLDRHHNNGILNGLDMGEVHISEDLERSVSQACCNGDTNQHKGTDSPVLASIFGHFLRSPGAILDVDKCVEDVIDISDAVEGDSDREEDRIDFLKEAHCLPA